MANEDNVHKYTIDEITRVVDYCQRNIEQLVGKFIHSGYNIWTTQQLLEESYLVVSKLNGRKITLQIDREGEFVVNPGQINKTDRKNCQAMSQVLNVVVKQAMRETGLIQMGKRPQFYSYENPMSVENMNIQIWSGFKTCAYKYSDMCTLVIDNCYKFMSTNTVLHLINQTYDEIEEQYPGDLPQSRKTRMFQEQCRSRIVNKSIIANYGSRKNYVVTDIKFEPGPCADFFELKNGQSISIARYFFTTYKLKVTNPKQPMLVVRSQGKNIKIPSEFCLIDGVPSEIRNSTQHWRKCLSKISQKPQEKMKSLEKLM